MQYRKFPATEEEVSLFGFGTMRFPVIDKDESRIDEEESIRMIRTAIDNGVNYVDTAFMYHGGHSEVVVGKALKDGYREKVYLADKFPVWMIRQAGGIEALFEEQLRRLDVDRIDFYLVHALDQTLWKKVKEKGVLPYLLQLKKKGKIGKLGFSFHDDLSVFKEIVDEFPWEFCQIQLNYIDTEFQAGVEGLRYAGERGLPVIIMEPLKGGKLTEDLPESVSEVWNRSENKRSPAEWAFRYMADFPEVLTILSGVSTMEQVRENLAIFSNEEPLGLNETDRLLVSEAAAEYQRLTKAGCTACRYCMPCPQGINIPVAIDYYNQWYRFHAYRATKRDFELDLPGDQRPSRCTECRECEEKCPQKLPVSDIMRETADLFEKE
ncbi:MAG: aldo/keto reductase [Firmicutes bacterium HGW-Firmicutes-11]|jgi:hypothetical protein|nr:MAG: aldo/keto reductase [Firmicutes bacterium HGW-Firmicutes-11]